MRCWWPRSAYRKRRICRGNVLVAWIDAAWSHGVNLGQKGLVSQHLTSLFRCSWNFCCGISQQCFVQHGTSAARSHRHEVVLQDLVAVIRATRSLCLNLSCENSQYRSEWVLYSDQILLSDSGSHTNADSDHNWHLCPGLVSVSDSHSNSDFVEISIHIRLQIQTRIQIQV